MVVFSFVYNYACKQCLTVLTFGGLNFRSLLLVCVVKSRTIRSRPRRITSTITVLTVASAQPVRDDDPDGFSGTYDA